MKITRPVDLDRVCGEPNVHQTTYDLFQTALSAAGQTVAG
jgi:hypothetical protein